MRLLFGAVCLLSLWMLFSPGSDTSSTLVDDKLVHAALFAALALTGQLAGVGLAPLVIGLATYAGVSEVVQGLLPIDREADLLDVLADLAGIGVGVAAALAGQRLTSSGTRWG